MCLWYKKCVQAKDRALFQLLSLSCQSVTSLSARCAVTVQVVIFELNSLLTSSSTPHSLVFLSFRQMAEVSHCWNRESTCTRPLSSQRTSTSCFRRSHCPVRALRAVTPCSPHDEIVLPFGRLVNSCSLDLSPRPLSSCSSTRTYSSRYARCGPRLFREKHLQAKRKMFHLRQVVSSNDCRQAKVEGREPPILCRVDACFVRFDLETCFAPQRRAIFMSHLAGWHCALHFSNPTFRPSRPTNHWKNIASRSFP